MYIRLEANDARKSFFLFKKLNIFKITSSGRSSRGKGRRPVFLRFATGIFSSAGPIAVTRLEREKEMGIKSSDSMEAEHPIVKMVNGKKTLYVSPGHLMEIKNVDKKDAVYLKKYLIDHVNKKEFIFSYEWSKGDICLWDNLSILHMASEIKNCRRVMHRITMK